MSKYFWTIFCLFSLFSFSVFSEDESVIRRLHAFLAIQDYASAIEEAENALPTISQSAALYEVYIQILAKQGEEKKMIRSWELYIERFPNKKMNRELIEEMAWGILNKAFYSQSIPMRQMALLAAFFSQESKGVNILDQGMRDSNYAVRALAVKLSSHFRDQKLIDNIKRLFKCERVWSVRKELIEAIGKMKIENMRHDLEEIISSNENRSSEKALAITALLNLLDEIDRKEIERLANSNRAGLRQLASEAIAYFQSMRDFDLLMQLAKDSNPDVRSQALQAIGQLHPHDEKEEISILTRQSLKDYNDKVAISAAWLLTLYFPAEGQQHFEILLNDERSEVRSLAGTALASTGQYGMPLIFDQFMTHPDPCVRLNLALGLIRQREKIQESSTFIKECVLKQKDKWSKLESGLFTAIYNQPKKKEESSFLTIESENQLIRLELLNLLAILKIPEAQQAIREFLLERSWEISATAATLLLTEGDDSAIALVEKLLHDPVARVRLQAALILSLWSREESAIVTLEENYLDSDWEQKSKVLEGLGRIGSTHSIPFLIQALKEPSQTLRLISAMAIIQCLNH